MSGLPDSRAPRTAATGEAQDTISTPSLRGSSGSASGPYVALMRDRFVQGWPGHEDGERVYLAALGTVLTREWTTDTHFAQYASPNGRRLRVGAVEHLGVPLAAIVFDIDCVAVHGTSEPAPASWRLEMGERFSALDIEHPGGFRYDTRGGCRIVFAQAEPTILRSAEDARRWRQHYTVACAYLERRFGVVADSACADWTRLFRAPFVTRDGKRERRATFGDPNSIGVLSIDATAADVARGREINPRAFNDRQLASFGPCASDGHGLLFHLLNARGDVKRKRDQNSYVIRCPNDREHTTGRAGDGSTILYLPAAGEHVGAIACLHGHCAGFRVRDWVRMFSRAELETAERAAGITRAA